MIDYSQRRLPLISVLLLYLCILCLTDAGFFRSEGKDIVTPESPSRQIPLRDAPVRSESVKLSGDDEYQAACEILQFIHPPPRRLARFTKPSSMFGTSVYYAKQLLYLLFMNGPRTTSSQSSSTHRLSEPLSQAVKLLSQSVEQHQNPDAAFVLAEMSFYGTHTYPRHYSQAFENYELLARIYGNSTAQYMLGFMYATGIGGVVEKDQAKALLYHTFAADAGDIRSQMTLGYRYMAGIATPRNCEKAVHYYKKVADRSMAFIRSGPPGGQHVRKDAVRLSDENGGVYGLNAKSGNPVSSENGRFGDVLEYIYLMSKKGDIKATFAIGKMHYEGSRALQRDYRIAKEKFLEVARRYWRQDGGTRQDTENDVEKSAAKAAGYLGRMFLRGEGMEQNFAKARIWFERGRANSDALCEYSLGIMHLHGLGAPRDPVKAAEYFGAAADQGFATAQVRLGALFMDQGNLDTAYKYFELAAENHHIEAFYFLAEIINLGLNKERNCNQAALFYKIVAEKAESVHSSFGEANDAYEDGDVETALQFYMQAAEQGYEEAQSNVAYLLDKMSGASRSRLARLVATASSYISMGQTAATKAKAMLGDASLALIYWTRSANQANIESLMKMGDYYLTGLGTSSVASFVSIPDPEKAAICYSVAADTMRSAQAYWNLGWMHENGLGVEQDFHLAKRYYDQCGETNKDARATVAIALTKLRLRSWWNWITGGKVHSMHDESDRGKYKYSLAEWLANFLAANLEDMYKMDRTQQQSDEWDTLNHAAGSDREQGLYGEEYWGEGGDSLLEVAVIVTLACALAGLVWFRQMAALRERRQQAQAEGRADFRAAQGPEADGAALFDPVAGETPAGDAPQGNNGLVGQQDQEDHRNNDNRGLFPRPGDPEYPEWVAGGIGH